MDPPRLWGATQLCDAANCIVVPTGDPETEPVAGLHIISSNTRRPQTRGSAFSWKTLKSSPVKWRWFGESYPTPSAHCLLPCCFAAVPFLVSSYAFTSQFAFLPEASCPTVTTSASCWKTATTTKTTTTIY